MADISKLKVGANSYDIKDTIARNNVNYSTSEQLIGKWIDGKNIYRKVYELTCTLDNNYYYVYTGDSSTIINIDSLIRFDYFIYNGTVVYPVPNSKSYNSMVYIQRSYGAISISCDTNVASVFNGKPLKIILEYTKVTE